MVPDMKNEILPVSCSQKCVDNHGVIRILIGHSCKKIWMRELDFLGNIEPRK